MKNNIKEFLYELEINAENLKAYNEMIEQQLQDLDGDKVSAEFNNGVLTVVVPTLNKIETKKTIEIE